MFNKFTPLINLFTHFKYISSSISPSKYMLVLGSTPSLATQCKVQAVCNRPDARDSHNIKDKNIDSANIFKTEKGTPTPPRVESLARTTAQTQQVFCPNLNKLITNYMYKSFQAFQHRPNQASGRKYHGPLARVLQSRIRKQSWDTAMSQIDRDIGKRTPPPVKSNG